MDEQTDAELKKHGDTLPKESVLDKKIFSTREALSDSDLKSFCHTNSLEYNLIDLNKLHELNTRFAFIFTGFDKDEFNKGHNKHWLFVDGTLVFDSYGGKKDYIFPEGFELIQNHPPQLQEFNSTVCGEYCCAFYKFIIDNPTLGANEIGVEFAEEHGFTNNRRENDRIIFTWYDENSDRSP